MIQRQRADIREYLDEDTPFPERETTEDLLQTHPGVRKLFDDVMASPANRSRPVAEPVHRRVRWWSAIALLRCLASSPAAAEQTLLNRSALKDIDDSTEAARRAAGPRILDTDLDDTTEGEDTALGADTSNDHEPGRHGADVGCAHSPPRQPHSRA